MRPTPTHGRWLVEAGTPSSKDDPLSDIDRMLRAVRARDWQLAEGAAFDLDSGREFLEQFSRLCDTEVRPVMEAVATRLSIYGGGGMVEMRRGGDPRARGPRLTIWLSLKEEIIGIPSPERHAYLSVEANADRRNISITSSFGSPEARQDQTTAWPLPDLTQENVTRELTEIIRRLVTSL
jgi:hypothetical protein